MDGANAVCLEPPVEREARDDGLLQAQRAVSIGGARALSPAWIDQMSRRLQTARHEASKDRERRFQPLEHSYFGSGISQEVGEDQVEVRTVPGQMQHCVQLFRRASLRQRRAGEPRAGRLMFGRSRNRHQTLVELASRCLSSLTPDRHRSRPSSTVPTRTLCRAQSAPVEAVVVCRNSSGNRSICHDGRRASSRRRGRFARRVNARAAAARSQAVMPPSC